MYKVEANEFSTLTNKLLSNVCELLQEQNKLLEQFCTQDDINIVEEIKIENKANIDSMNRSELLAIIKTLPKGTIKGKYMTLELEELRKQVKEVMQ